MAITYYMLQMPPAIFFILMVGLCSLLAALGAIAFRKLVRIKVQRSHNEVTGFLFLAIASFYALLLSFVVLVVWDQLNETVGIVSKEGSSAMAMYDDIKFYPNKADAKLLEKSYLEYVFNVVNDEFPNMQKMQGSRVTSESFDMVFLRMVNLHPKTQMEIQLVSGMFSQLNTLQELRGQRLTSMEAEISPPMWLPMIFGAIVTVFCALLLDIEHQRMHVLLVALLGSFVGMFFFTIIRLDHPYAGSQGLKPERYMQIFTKEEWMNEQPTTNLDSLSYPKIIQQ